MKAAIILQRVSSEQQADNMSIGSQENFNREVLSQKGFTVVRSFSEVKSGKGMRKTVQDAFDFAKRWNSRKTKSNQIQLLAVYDWSRWFRNVDLSGYWKYKFQEIGVEVNATSEWADAETYGSTMIRSIKMAMAEEERKANSKRTRINQYHTVKAGYLLGKPPRGIAKSFGPDGKKWIELDPVLGPLYRQAFSRIAAGETPAQVYYDLGGKDIFGGRSTFYVALRNEVYHGRKKYPSPTPELPDLDVELKAHETITDFITFQKVQRVVERNPSTPKRVESDTMFVAKKVVHCPVCNSIMSTESSQGRKKKYHYYRCGHSASHYRVRRERVDEFITTLLKDLTMEKEAADFMEQEVTRRVDDMKRQTANKIGLLKRDLDKAKNRVENGLNLLLDGTIKKGDFEILKERVADIELQIEQQKFFQQNQGIIIGRFMEMFTNLEPMYTRLTPAGKMEFLKMVFPEGITLEHDDPNSQILICRTDRMNYIFDAIPRESIKYRYIKIGTNGEKAESPVKGG